MSQQRPSDPPPPAAPSILHARRLLREREQRAELFSHRAGLFSDPAWDMLLALFVADTDQRSVGVGEACAAAWTPPTTGLRYVELLVGTGLISKRADPDDDRSCCVELTPRGRDEMMAYLAAVAC